MKLIQFLKNESTEPPYKLVFMAVVAGLSNAMVLAVINRASEQISQGLPNSHSLLLFALSIILYIVAQRYILVGSAAEVEGIIHQFRVRFAALLSSCNLEQLESIGRARIYSTVTTETLTISQSVTALIIGAQSAILVFFTSIYVAWLSLPAFFICATFVAVAIAIHFERLKDLHTQLHLASAKENELFSSLTDLLDGFKEVKLNDARRTDLLDDLNTISYSTAHIKVETQHGIANHLIFSQATFYLLLATIVFLVPRFLPTYIDVLVKLTTAILFLMGPISVLTGSLPILSRANSSAENIFALEAALQQPQPARAARQGVSLLGFREIRFEAVSFTYQDRGGTEVPFTVGPIDVCLRAGEIIFIEGGNGSGKSTFMKLLTGLCYPTSGQIKVDGIVVDASNRRAYRDLISAVFSDYHLFKRLYGLRNVPSERVNELLRKMEIEHKTALFDGEFQTLELSSGQKKRLALLVSYLEDRPLMVFDEWAADQDPLFRRKFYTQLLQELRAQGKTIIAVSHDDAYFDVADTLLKMREGKLYVERQKAPGLLLTEPERQP